MKQLCSLYRDFFSLIAGSLVVLLLMQQSALAQGVLVPANTRVQIVLPNPISSNSLDKEKHLNASVFKTIEINGKVVVKENALATLDIQRVRRAAAWGKKGVIQLSGGSVVAADGTKIPVQVSYSAKGKSRRAFTISYLVLGILTVPLFGVGLVLIPIAIAQRGTDARLGDGTVFDALTTAPVEVGL